MAAILIAGCTQQESNTGEPTSECSTSTSNNNLQVIPAQTFTSDNSYTIKVKRVGTCNWEHVGETPGTIEIPECQDRMIWINFGSIDVATICDEIAANNFRRIGFSCFLKDDLLQQVHDHGILSSVESLSLHWVSTIDLLAEIPNITSLDLGSCQIDDISPLVEMKNLTLSFCQQI